MDILVWALVALCGILIGAVVFTINTLTKVIKSQSTVILSERLCRDDDASRRIISNGLAENLADRQVRDEDDVPPPDDGDGWTSVGP